MANTAIQLFGCILSYVGLCGLIASTIMTEWKTYAHTNGDPIQDDEAIGLWMKCTKRIAGQVTCIPFSSLFFQTWETNVSRALMIISIILCSIASLVVLFGLKCSKSLDQNKKAKNMVATVAGALFILGGLCAFGLISWFAYKISEDFYSQSSSNKYELGKALFVGWSAAVLCVTGGSIICICSRTTKQHRPYTVKIPMSKEPGTEYV